MLKFVSDDIMSSGQETCSQNEKTMCYKWDQPGLQSNFYWEETESHIPRRIFQSVSSFIITMI